MKVLIVDDQESARLLLRTVVESIDKRLTVWDFDDPLAALEWSKRYEPDLLLLDYRMPELDGIEFARRFRSNPRTRDVPILLVSVEGDESVQQAARNVGAADFLVKPVRSSELRSRCKSLLQLRLANECIKASVHPQDPSGHDSKRLSRMIEFASSIAMTLSVPYERERVLEISEFLREIEGARTTR